MKQGYINFTGSFLAHTATTVGKKEMDGPMSRWFDGYDTDEYFGMPTFEQGESEMVRRNLDTLYQKANLKDEEIGVLPSSLFA